MFPCISPDNGVMLRPQKCGFSMFTLSKNTTQIVSLPPSSGGWKFENWFPEIEFSFSTNSSRFNLAWIKSFWKQWGSKASIHHSFCSSTDTQWDQILIFWGEFSGFDWPHLLLYLCSCSWLVLTPSLPTLPFSWNPVFICQTSLIGRVRCLRCGWV